jgi:membrane protease YdiL (CAAX protease family)
MPVWLLVLSLLVIGVAEEVLYRGYAISRIEGLTGSTFAACLISTLCFALAYSALGNRTCVHEIRLGGDFRRPVRLAAGPPAACRRACYDGLAGLLLPRLLGSGGQP